MPVGVTTGTVWYDELSLTGAGDLTVTARDESGVFAQSGAVSIAAGTGKTQEGSLSVSIGASVSINEIGEHEGYGVRAFIDNSTVDVNGNVFCTGPGGVWVFDPAGELLGRIEPPEIPANLAWGDDDLKTLYMTARTGLYRIRIQTGGAPLVGD